MMLLDNYKIALCITGGGTSIIPNILTKGGASKYIVDIQVPYSCEAIDKYLRHKPDKYCSEDTAKELAAIAYLNCRSLSSASSECVSMAVTCSLMKENEREGRENYGYVCVVVSDDICYCKQIKIDKTVVNTRKKQEEFIAEESLDYLYQILYDEHYHSGSILEECCKYGIENVYIPIHSNLQTDVIFPGSFNPLHQGHIDIIKQYPNIDLEISIENVDKPKLRYHDIVDRIIQEVPENVNGFWITHLPKMVDKIRYFGNKTFVMGADTYNRLHDKKYDNPSRTQVHLDKELIYNTKIDIYQREGYWTQYSSPKHTPRSTKITNISSSQIRGDK